MFRSNRFARVSVFAQEFPRVSDSFLLCGVQAAGDGHSFAYYLSEDERLYDLDETDFKLGHWGSCYYNTRRQAFAKKCKSNELTRIAVAKNMFESLLDKTAAYDFPHRYNSLAFLSFWLSYCVKGSVCGVLALRFKCCNL